MNTLGKIIILFLAITGASSILMQNSDVVFGEVDFWKSHGFFFLVFITLFPRLTLLFSSVASGGFIWWIAWAFAPRILVTFLATTAYWNTNPILVIIAWLVALGGESSEKTVFINKGKPYVFKKSVNLGQGYSSNEPQPSTDTFEAEFKVKEEES
jgi:hypothetical protein